MSPKMLTSSISDALALALSISPDDLVMAIHLRQKLVNCDANIDNNNSLTPLELKHGAQELKAKLRAYIGPTLSSPNLDSDSDSESVMRRSGEIPPTPNVSPKRPAPDDSISNRKRVKEAGICLIPKDANH